MPDPLQTVQQAIDRTFGDGFARDTRDCARVLIAAGLREIAVALAEPEEETQQHIVPARQLLRPRP